MRRIGLLLVVGLSFWACKKPNNLDLLAFPSERLEVYEFDAYENEWDVEIPASYTIDEANRTLFSITSHDESTGEDFEIYCVYLGDIDNIANDSIILYGHGQSLHMDAYWTRATILANLEEKHHYGVLMMDYRGYGMSEGSSDEEGLAEDVDACITWLKEQGADPTKTTYYGFSLGCIPIIDRAAYRTDFVPTKIILEAPLASVENLANTSTIINVDPGYMSTLKFENAEKIKDVAVPLMWLHGIEDAYVAIGNGELIYENHGGEYKEAHRVAGSDHAEIPEKMGLSAYMVAVTNFLNH